MRLLSTRHTLTAALVTFAALAAPAPAGALDAGTVLTPQDVKWGPAPPVLRPGAQAVVLYGDPGKDGQFAMRLKLPKGYAIAPHTHPKPEVVTVLSGTFRLGMGPMADRDKAKALPTGSFFALEPGMAHYAFADEDTVVQLNSVGPWGLVYVDPKDDPRKTQ